jgi:EAL domain-containing protein (putative c-di-GMP-specific phosphodiesterase class I)
MPDRDPATPDPAGPATGSPPDSLPTWARPAATPAEPGARWLMAARRWWGLAEGGGAGAPPGAAAPGAPAASPRPMAAAAGAGSASGSGPASAPRPGEGPPEALDVPAPLLERLQRNVAHAVRHPGHGFAVLRVQLKVAPARSARPRGADVGRQAERRLQLALRPGDALAPLARPGAFAAVLDGVGSEAALEQLARRLARELAEPYLDGHEPVRPAWRLAAVFCAPGQPPRPAEALLQRAEQALAGAEAGHWVITTPQPPPPGAHRLQQALVGRSLQLALEPQVDFARAGVTALGVRLALPDAPGQALGPAEAGDDDQLAAALLQHQLQRAAEPFLRWRAADRARQACRLALPVATPLVRRAGWADELAALLQGAGLDGADVQLELPPTLPLHDRNLPARLQALARQRLSLALDDFGTGQSSLSALGRLPLALIKIDRGFVPQAHELEHHRVLLESTVQAASRLGIATLGKGLQTVPQLALLRGLGCQRGEGAAARALLAPGLLDGVPLEPAG